MTVLFKGVTKKYGAEFSLRNINLEFQKGKIYGLLGPNGSGKSTTLKMIAGLVYPDHGTVTVSGKPANRKISSIVSYMSELDMFYDAFTVKQMLSFYASQFPDFDSKKARMLLKEMNLTGDKKIKQLSKGNRGRLKLILALARHADILLLDEPFSGLDALVRDSIVRSILAHIKIDKQVVIIATHEIAELEPLLDEVIAICNGNIIGQENVEKLREEQGISVLEWFKRIMHQQESPIGQSVPVSKPLFYRQ